MYIDRVISGMRPTGRLHLGHYHGVLKHWLKLQDMYQSMFFVSDLHALTTHHTQNIDLEEYTIQMVIDWLSVGIDQNSSILFLQSMISEHAQLYLILSMITPVSWLERVPTYKEQQDRLSNLDLSSMGFLGYPLLQAADILLYKARYVPVGEDQLPHIELARAVARRFNYLYGKEDNIEEKILSSINSLGRRGAKIYNKLRIDYQEKGNIESLEHVRVLLSNNHTLSNIQIQRLFGYFEGSGRNILLEPEALLSQHPRFPGLDGGKMSKSYDNFILLREEKSVVEDKIRRMPTDPSRVKRTDPGNPNKCPVYLWHNVYSNDEIKSWVEDGCYNAKIGCIECKQHVINSVLLEQEPIIERANKYISDINLIKNILADGCEKARAIAKESMQEIESAVNFPNI